METTVEISNDNKVEDNIHRVVVSKHDTKQTYITILRILSIFSLLLEDLLALFLQSDKFDDRNVFWIMFAFGCISGLFGFCSMINKYTCLILLISSEITQTVLFIWICDWISAAMITMILLLCIQIGIEVYLFYNETENDDTNSLCIGVCSNCCNSLIVGLYILPFMYYDEHSYFRSTWFNIWITFMFWLSAINSSFTPAAIFKNDGKLKKKEDYFLVIVIIFGIINWIFTFILCCLYIPHTTNVYEVVFTYYMVITDSFGFCIIGLLFCVICPKREKLKQQWMNNSSQPMDVDKAENCPQNHGLKEFMTPSDKYGCNICRRRVKINCKMYGCRICDFDVCVQCIVLPDDNDKRSMDNTKTTKTVSST